MISFVRVAGGFKLQAGMVHCFILNGTSLSRHSQIIDVADLF
jgi:hypothetical protein